MSGLATEATIQARLSDGDLVLADFHAGWCAPCRAQRPILDRLAETMAGVVEIVKVDVDAFPAVAERYGVRALPTLLLMSGGDVVKSFLGLTREDKLTAAIHGLTLTAIA